MSPSLARDPGVYLEDIATAASLLEEFLHDKVQEDYLSDILLQSAVERQLMIVGEAVGRLARLDGTLAAQISEHEKIIGLRNVLVHAYAEVDPNLVWATISSDLGRLQAEVTALLAEE